MSNQNRCWWAWTVTPPQKTSVIYHSYISLCCMHCREKTQLCASPLLTAHASSLPDLISAVDLFKLLIIQAWRVGYSEGAVLLEFKEKESPCGHYTLWLTRCLKCSVGWKAADINIVDCTDLYTQADIIMLTCSYGHMHIIFLRKPFFNGLLMHPAGDPAWWSPQSCTGEESKYVFIHIHPCVQQVGFLSQTVRPSHIHEPIL